MEQCLQRDWQLVVEYIIKEVSTLCRLRITLLANTIPLWM